VTPSVGCIVHYVSYGTPRGEYVSTCRAAIIAGVHLEPESQVARGNVDLVVLNPAGLFFQECGYDQAGRPGTWHWPEPA
jgi:hypothetical protein